MTGSEQNIPEICIRHGCRKQALRKFCSVACRVAHHNSRRAPASKVRITCLGCGPTTQAGDSHLTGWRPAAIVMCHAAGNAAELAERLFAATMANTDLRYILFGACHLELKKMLHSTHYQ